MSNSEFAKSLQEKRRNQIRGQMENNPDFAIGKKVVFYIVAILSLLTAIDIVLQLIPYIVYSIPIVMQELLSAIWAFAFGVLLLIATYNNGYKACIFINLARGLLSLWLLYSQEVFSYFTLENVFFSILAAYAIAIRVIIVITMIFILTNKPCKAYIETITDIRKEIQNDMKNQQIK